MGHTSFSQGKANAAKTMVPLVGFDSQGYFFKGIAIKAVGVFSTADLAGTWHYFSFWDSVSGNDPGWDRGTVTMNSSGTVTGGSFVGSDGNTATVTGGSLSLDGNGVITSGFIIFSNAMSSTIWQGKMDSGKATATFVGSNSQGFLFHGNAIEASGGAADFDGDGESDVAVFRGGAWLFHDFTTGAQNSGVWTGSTAGCIPVAMDYDGDGKTDFTQFCNGAWHFYDANGSYNKGIWTGEVTGDRPVPADYNGDGTDDVVVYRTGAWLFYDFTTGAFDAAKSIWTGGGTGCVPVPMDYDGDGIADFTQLCNGAWHFYNDNGSYNKGIWTGGAAGDLPVPADYNGNGTDDVVVFRGGAWLFYDFTTGALDATEEHLDRSAGALDGRDQLASAVGL